jgi:hypothetical protein
MNMAKYPPSSPIYTGESMSKRKEIRERRRKEKQRNRMIMIGVMIIGAGLIAAALIYPSTQLNNEFRSRYMANGNAMGNPDAPVTITEYSDYKCGHCANFALETEPLLEEAYIERIRFISYPALLAICSAVPPLYWHLKHRIVRVTKIYIGKCMTWFMPIRVLPLQKAFWKNGQKPLA